MTILVLSNLYPPVVIGGYELVCKQAVDALMAWEQFEIFVDLLDPDAAFPSDSGQPCWPSTVWHPIKAARARVLLDASETSPL